MKLDFLSQAARPLIEIFCPMNPPPNYILDDATRIQHGAARRILGWPSGRGSKRQLEMSTDHFGLRLPNFRTIQDSMFVNTTYAFIINLDPQVRIMFRHMVEEVRVTVGIPRVPHGKIFMDWDLTTVVPYATRIRKPKVWHIGSRPIRILRQGVKSGREVRTKAELTLPSSSTYVRPLG